MVIYKRDNQATVADTAAAAPAPNAIPNRYVVLLKPNLSESEYDEHTKHVHDQCIQRFSTGTASVAATTQKDAAKGVNHRYQIGNLKGYSGYFDEETKAQIEGSWQVTSIQPDHYVYTADIVTQDAPSWGLARLSRDRPVNPDDPADMTHVYDDAADGQGTTAYVVDTGVFIEHEDFGGRARWGTTIPAGASDSDSGRHGTHVAGTIAGNTFGVAKEANIVAVKVFPDGERPPAALSDVAKGIEWAVNDAQTRGDIQKCVVNLSLGGPPSEFLDKVASAAVGSGMTLVVAAGNDDVPGNTSSPARVPEVITVGATDIDDSIAIWSATQGSNYGSILDILAPGTDIVSCGIDSPTDTATLSGTSMASPHVAGVVCCLVADPAVNSPAEVARRLRATALTGQVSGLTGPKGATPNFLLHSPPS